MHISDWLKSPSVHVFAVYFRKKLNMFHIGMVKPLLFDYYILMELQDVQIWQRQKGNIMRSEKNQDIVLHLREWNGDQNVDVRIRDVEPAGRGASFIAYHGFREDLGNGIIKILCPARHEEKNLRCQHFIQAQKSIRRILGSNDMPESLDAFITWPNILVGPMPSFLHGDGMENTYFVWQRYLTPLSDWVNEKTSEKGCTTEADLDTLLSVFELFTGYISDLHGIRITAGDIKPDNIGVALHGADITGISLLDTESLVPSGTTTDFTMGFFDASRPACAAGDASTDIYAIGASLYASLNGKPKDGYLKKEDASFESVLRNSPFLTCLPEGSWKNRITADLSDIFSMTIGGIGSMQVQDASQLHEAFRDVLSDFREKTVLRKSTSPDLVCLYALLSMPIPMKEKGGQRRADVVLAGFDKEHGGQIFFKYLVPLLLVLADQPTLRILSRSEKEVKDYLASCPSVVDFFHVEVNGRKICGDHPASVSYGNLIFETEDPAAGKSMKQLFFKALQTFPQAAVISLDRTENSRLLDGIHSIVDYDRFVCYCLQDGEETELDSRDNRIIYVGLDGQIPADPASRLFHHAYAEDLVWRGYSSAGFVKAYWEKKWDVREPYRFSSSLTGVAAMFWRLQRLNIPMRNLDDAAAEYQKKIKDRKIFDDLLFDEHRRWVAEKVLSGWKPMSVEDAVAEKDTKDQKEHLHCCILAGIRGKSLAQMDSSIWDDVNADLSGLDDLDRFSICLHRAYREEAERTRAAALWRGGLDDLERNISSSVSAYPQLYSCAQDLFRIRKMLETENNGYSNEPSMKQHEAALCRVFLDQFKGLMKESDSMDASKKRDLFYLLDSWEKISWAQRKAAEYRDWKKIDMDIVKNVPFILTFSPDVCLVIPLRLPQDDESETIFDNAAAVMALQPKTAVFTAICPGTDREWNILANTLDTVRKLLQKKQIWTSMNLLLICIDGSTKEAPPESAQEVEIPVSYVDGSPDDSVQMLKNMAGNCRICVEQDDSSPAGIYLMQETRKDFPFFHIQTENGFSLSCDKGAGFLSYIPTDPALSVGDMLDLQNTTARTAAGLGEQRDILLKLASDAPEAFSDLCSEILAAFEKEETIRTFQASSLEAEPSVRLKDILSDIPEDVKSRFAGFFLENHIGKSVMDENDLPDVLVPEAFTELNMENIDGSFDLEADWKSGEVRLLHHTGSIRNLSLSDRAADLLEKAASQRGTDGKPLFFSAFYRKPGDGRIYSLRLRNDVPDLRIYLTDPAAVRILSAADSIRMRGDVCDISAPAYICGRGPYAIASIGTGSIFAVWQTEEELAEGKFDEIYTAARHYGIHAKPVIVCGDSASDSGKAPLFQAALDRAFHQAQQLGIQVFWGLDAFRMYLQQNRHSE